jgi:RTX calcium-binding nonapeptide repeat (4 copies)
MMQVTKRRRRGALTILAILAFMAGAAPSAGHEPTGHLLLAPSHFNGDGVDGSHGPDANGNANEAQIVGDAFDGNNTYMLRAIAAPETKYYEWYLPCPPGANPFQPPFGKGECGNPVARDDTPTFSAPPPGAQQVAAFSAPLDITMDGNVGVKGVACIEGPPSRAAHCITGAVDPVHLDDASTTEHVPTDSGEFIQPGHGATVLNAGFTAVVFSSQSDFGRVFFCLDVGTNPATAEDASPQTGCDGGSAFDATPNDSPACSGVPAGVHCWEAPIDPPDDAEFSLAAVEQDISTVPHAESGSGDCENDSQFLDGTDNGDDCQLDKIYLTSLPTLPQAPSGPACPGFKNDRRNQIVGTKKGDELLGSKAADVICGLGGNDVARGLGGKDVLLGAGGKDRLSGGPKADLLKGGSKDDRLNGGPGKDKCRGGGGRDSLVSC